MIHIVPPGEEEYHFITDCPCKPVLSIDEETGEELCTHIPQTATINLFGKDEDC